MGNSADKMKGLNYQKYYNYVAEAKPGDLVFV